MRQVFYQLYFAIKNLVRGKSVGQAISNRILYSQMRKVLLDLLSVRAEMKSKRVERESKEKSQLFRSVGQLSVRLIIVIKSEVLSP
jgi:hypothetical protein